MSNQTSFNPNGIAKDLTALEAENPDIMQDFEAELPEVKSHDFAETKQEAPKAPAEAPKKGFAVFQKKEEHKNDRFANFQVEDKKNEFGVYVDKKTKELMEQHPELKARLESALEVATKLTESMNEKGMKPKPAMSQNGTSFIPSLKISAKEDEDKPNHFMVRGEIKSTGSNTINLYFNRDGSEITNAGVSRMLSQKAQQSLGKKMEYVPLDAVADHQYLQSITKEMVQHIQENGFVAPKSELKQFVKDANEFLKENGSKVQSQTTGQYVSDVYLTHEVREYQGKTYETANLHMHSVNNMVVSLSIGNDGGRYMQAVEFFGKGVPSERTRLTEENFEEFAQKIPPEASEVMVHFMEQENKRELTLLEQFAIHLNAETFKEGRHVQVKDPKTNEERTVAIANANYKSDDYGEHVTLYSRTENGEKTNIIVELNSNGSIVATDFNNQDDDGRYLKLVVNSEETFQQLSDVLPQEIASAVEEFLDVREQLKFQKQEKPEQKRNQQTFGND